MKQIDSVLKQVLEKVKPSDEELDEIKSSLKSFLKQVEEGIKRQKIDAEIFVGGSFAKKTVIKKEEYDVDVFARFEKKYKTEKISELIEKVVGGIKNTILVHGSRDYFRTRINPSLFIEVIPVIKVNNPKEAENITDLSYSHVNYINKKIKSKKILDEIILAKAFCHANNCYGAESYIHGFSGYALELLVYHYGGFLKFIKAVSKSKGQEKIVIDIEKYFRNKQEVLMNLNSSKLQSPIILIDPTYKQRNVLAALSDATFAHFQEVCRKFLKNPSISAFEIKKIDLEKIKRDAKTRKLEFVMLEIKTNKQEGDIAGSKLLKFYEFLSKEISRFFEIKNRGFSYGKKQSARCFFAVKNKKEILFGGPEATDIKNAIIFKKRHKDAFEKHGKLCAKEKIKFNLRTFIKNWKVKNKRVIKEMYIKGLEMI